MRIDKAPASYRWQLKVCANDLIQVKRRERVTCQETSLRYPSKDPFWTREDNYKVHISTQKFSVVYHTHVIHIKLRICPKSYREREEKKGISVKITK